MSFLVPAVVSLAVVGVLVGAAFECQPRRERRRFLAIAALAWALLCVGSVMVLAGDAGVDFGAAAVIAAVASTLTIAPSALAFSQWVAAGERVRSLALTAAGIYIVQVPAVAFAVFFTAALVSGIC